MKPDDFFNAVREAIHVDFHRTAHNGLLTHHEQHDADTASEFSIRPTCKMVAFSLDVRGANPFPVFNASVAGLTAKNDLTIICENKGKVYVFVIEYKNSANPGNAQHQIECGMAFAEYLFKLLRYCQGLKIEPHIFGVAAYRPRRPAKGQTNPQIRFSRQGLHDILRAEWIIDDAFPLPLSELVRAAESCFE